MKKTDLSPFTDFMLDEATKYGVALTRPEIDLWFETFARCTLEDFRAAWVQHKRDDKRGHYFPKIPWLQKLLKVTGEENAKRDWRCCEELNGERCGFPGSINGGHGWQCRSHFRLKGSADYTPERSLQIIEASRSYVPPKTAMEAMERGSAQRALEAERWIKAHAVVPATRLETEPAIESPAPLATEPEAPARDLDDVNRAAEFAAQEGGGE